MRILSVLLLSGLVLAVTGCVSKGKHQQEIGSLQGQIAQMDMGVKAKQGIVDVSPLAANLYQGSVHGSLQINAQATPAITIKQQLSGILLVGNPSKDAPRPSPLTTVPLSRNRLPRSLATVARSPLSRALRMAVLLTR